MSTTEYPRLTLHPRSELPGLHSSVDVYLKTLKSSSKKLQVNLAALRNEMQILERLYYKGKNQHRTALFWRRVCEVRRYGDRFNHSRLDMLVESFRRSFWGPLHEQNTKTLKGPWTYFPDKNEVRDVHGRLFVVLALCRKSLERTSSAFQHIALCMQTGAFIQLSLTLYGIFARTHVLVAELRDATETCHKVCTGIFDMLDAKINPSIIGLSAVRPENSRSVTGILEAALKPVASYLPFSKSVSAPYTDPLTRPDIVGSDIIFEPKRIGPSTSVRKEKTSSKSETFKNNPKKREKLDEIDAIFGEKVFRA